MAALVATDAAADFADVTAALTFFAAEVTALLAVDCRGLLAAGFDAARVAGFAAVFVTELDAVLEAAFVAPVVADFADFARAVFATGFAAEAVLVLAPAFEAGFAAFADFLPAGFELAAAGALAAPRVLADFVDLPGVLAMISAPLDAPTHGITSAHDCPSSTRIAVLGPLRTHRVAAECRSIKR